jgi:ribulose-phosphate 3-epimerase
LAHAATHGYKLGIAATADIPLTDITALIPEVSFVQLMGIAAVGQQGQPFDVRTLARARELRDRYPDLEIAVDGAVNSETIPQLYAAGVNRFAPGSAITKASDPVLAYRTLQALVA